MNHLLVTCDLSWVRDPAAFRTFLGRRFEKVTLAPLTLTLDDLDIGDVTDWITDPAPRYKISAELLADRLPALCRIGSPSTGTTHIEAEILKSSYTIRCLRDIPQVNLARITSSSEHSFYLFLSLLRRGKRLFSADLARWRDDLSSFRGHQLAGMRVLIFGYGRIGSNLARYLEAFRADVSVYEPDLAKHTTAHRFVDSAELDAEISAADAVFLCFHWSEKNDRFFGPRFLNAMRADAYLVNTSRGENIDEDYLAELISRGKFAGIALDVLRGEQTPAFGTSPLFALERVTERLIITPHIAGASCESEQLAFEFILDALMEARL